MRKLFSDDWEGFKASNRSEDWVKRSTFFNNNGRWWQMVMIMILIS